MTADPPFTGEHTPKLDTELRLRLSAAVDDVGDSSIGSSAHESYEEVARCLALLDGVLDDTEDASTPSGQPLTDGGPAAHRLTGLTLGRFQVEGVLGRGGFGVVLLAYDEPLRRRVALKIPRPAQLVSRETQQRFLSEARAVALLSHPAIVPIYDVVSLGPVCILVCDYCPGPNLAAWLARHPRGLNLTRAAELVRELAEAVQHAHSRGVLHRDLKPSNVLLEPHSEEGSSIGSDEEFPYRPRLTDFGLAKRTSSETDFTQPGSRLGTLRYMAPEQAAGKLHEISVGTDVYALGVILYELLTGRVPLEGASEPATLAKILECDPPPLKLGRSRLARDLTAITEKCLRKPLAERYGSAQQLADDLHRALSGLPVAARPTTRLQRAVRWGQRRPALAGLSLALLASTVLGLTAVVLQYRSERQQRIIAEQSLNQLDRSVRALTETAMEWEGTEQSEALRLAILEGALDLQQTLVDQLPTDADSAHRLSEQLHYHSIVLAYLGRMDEAHQARSRGLALLEQLLEADPTNVVYRFDHFQNLRILVGISENWGPQQRLQTLLRARGEIASLVTEHPSNADYLDALSAAELECCRPLIALAHAGGASLEAERLLHEALEHCQRAAHLGARLVDEHPERAMYRKRVAEAESTAGELWRRLGEPRKAETALRSARDHYQALKAALPGDRVIALDAADALQRMTEVIGFEHPSEEAEALLTEERQILEGLIAKHPDVPHFQIRLAEAHVYAALYWHRRGRTDDAQASFRTAFAIGDDVVAKCPGVPRFQGALRGWRERCPQEIWLAIQPAAPPGESLPVP